MGYLVRENTPPGALGAIRSVGVLLASGQGRHSNPVILDDGEVRCPVVSALQRRQGDLRDLCGRRRCDSKEHDAARRGQRRVEGQFSKVLIERDDKTIFSLCASQYFPIANAGALFPDPGDVVSMSPKKVHGVSGEVFIGEDSHGSGRENERIDFLCAQHRAGVAQARLDVIVRQAGIVPQNLRFRPVPGEKVDDELDRQARSFDDRFPGENLRINDDAALPCHGFLPPLQALQVVVLDERAIVNENGPLARPVFIEIWLLR